MIKLQAALTEFDRMSLQVAQLMAYIDDEPDQLAKTMAVLRLGIYASGLQQLKKIIDIELDGISLDDLFITELKSGSSS